MGVYWERTGYWSGELDRALSRAPKRPTGAPVAVCSAARVPACGPRRRKLRVRLGRSDEYGHAPDRQGPAQTGCGRFRTDHLAAAAGGLE